MDTILKYFHDFRHSLNLSKSVNIHCVLTKWVQGLLSLFGKWQTISLHFYKNRSFMTSWKPSVSAKLEINSHWDVYCRYQEVRSTSFLWSLQKLWMGHGVMWSLRRGARLYQSVGPSVFPSIRPETSGLEGRSQNSRWPLVCLHQSLVTYISSAQY